MPPAQDLTANPPLAPAVAIPRIIARHWVLPAVLALTALTFLGSSQLTYDPWSWTIWGREVLHLDLNTIRGPSWKPLAVLFTTPFALAGDAAPWLWLFTARAAAIGGVFVMFGLVRRLGGGVVGGAAAAAAYAAAPWTIRNAALGNSEGMLVLCALWAVDRHLAGHRRQAFLLGLAAALLRPETWPFLGLYGLWLAWRMPAARTLVAAGFLSIPVLWFLPEWWGSGDLLRAMHRAQEPVPGSPAVAPNPVSAVIDRFETMMISPVWVGLAAFAIVLALRRMPGPREARAALALLAAGVALLFEVAFMAKGGGFSGGTRYLILSAALLIAVAGTGIGWAVRLLPARVLRPAVALVLAAVAAFAFAVPNNERLKPTWQTVRYEVNLTNDLATAVRAAGGRERLLACGAPYTEPFSTPKVAWLLHVHVGDVRLDPRRPGVVFQARNDASWTGPGPPLDGLGGERAVQKFAQTKFWGVFGACTPHKGTG